MSAPNHLASAPPTRRAARLSTRPAGRLARWRYRLARQCRSEPAARNLRTVRASLWRQRYLLAALWVIALAWWVIQALAPAPPGRSALVVRTPLPAGSQITASDVRPARLPTDAIPSDVITDLAQIRGRATRIALPAGTALSTALLTSSDLQRHLPAGFVAMPVVLEPGVSAIAQSGQWVSLYGLVDQGTTLLAERALVLQINAPADSALDITGAERYIDAVVAIDQQRATVLLDSLANAPLRAVLPASPGANTE